MPAIDVDRRVEPGTRAVLDRLPGWDLTSVDTIRSTYAAAGGPPEPPDPRVRRSDEVVAGLDGRPDVRVRWYRPADATGPLACVMWLHGGAYVMGDLDENDGRLQRMVVDTGCAVVSVDWRLAPEHPFPAGLEDAESVWCRITDDPLRFGVDSGRLVVGGASAGAGLAAGLCLRLRDAGLALPALQLLVYPMLDDREITPSIRAIADDPGHWGFWHLRANRLCWAAYLGELAGGDVPATAAPARAEDLSGLPPAFLAVGDVDAFVHENLAYAGRLVGAGVPTELHVYPGVIHGGYGAPPATPRTAQLLRDVHGAVRSVVAGEFPARPEAGR
ncbi:alpha/beta hydrolase [Nocardioides sp. TF02-7]|uniref:alpha/beta hydrolase n=1 Tax=Nocardioides sp. TF02-7 TaxID=2917724 RepID=UPI001F0599D7|nr:alpha/beta hydrolase [Nocardioides sp. TF02-7]UMG91298.1 alpha/beta hydrolase [Nocardioides sp. TF02-7]